MRIMDRFWLLTWTTYGTWLLGDSRGSVTTVSDNSGPRHRHNAPGTAFDMSMPGLNRNAHAQMKCRPIFLNQLQAEVIARQIERTVLFRGWALSAYASMCNHLHVLVGVNGDPEPAEILRDLKSYASRALNSKWPKPPSGRWWTESGSRRKLPNDAAIKSAIQYIRKQHNPLIVWTDEEDY
jgi:REP element-mobilizing transposase RayT